MRSSTSSSVWPISPSFPLIRTLKASALLLAMAVIGASTASPLGAQKRPMTILDLIAIPSVSSPHLSPDGSRLVYVKSEADWEENLTISHLFMVNADGSGTTQLTYGKEGQSNPSWSPDGQWIAFTARRGEEEATQIHLLPSGGGEARPLTNHETSVSSLSWSPDGTSLYFTASDPKTEEEKEKEKLRDDVYAFDENFEQVHLWKVDVETGEETPITSGDYSVGQYSVSRDGGRIAHMRAKSPLFADAQWAEVWLMDANGSASLQLTTDTVPQGSPQLSPDGRWVLFTADSNEEFDFYYNDKIFLISATGGEARVLLPDFSGAIDQATWSADGRSIVFRANIGLREELYKVDVESRALTRLTEGDHAVGSAGYDPANGLAAFTVQTATNPGDIWTMDVDGSGADLNG